MILSPTELHRLGGVLAAAASLGVESEFAIAAIRLLMLTGCRKNEVLTLRWAWIDRFHKCLRLPDSKTGAKVVHLGAPALRLLASLSPRPGNPHVFAGRTAGTHVTDLQSVWSRIRKSAELEDVRIHDLRHSFASIGANNGDSLLIIGALLGHRSAKTTERYAHLADHPIKSAADRIAERIALHLNLTKGDDGPEEQMQHEGFWGAEIAETETETADPILGSIIRTRWIDTQGAAAFLGMTVGTLQTYRWQGTGPTFQKVGRRVVYSQSALAAWKDIEHGHPSQSWLTFRQAQEAGGCVRKGERGVIVVYADRFIPKGEAERAAREDESARAVPFLKRFTVFNVAQCEGLRPGLAADPEPLPDCEIVPVAEALIKASKADFRIGGNKAFYVPSADFVAVPPQPAFFDQINYYRTCLHELTHWTGHASRLARDFSGGFLPLIFDHSSRGKKVAARRPPLTLRADAAASAAPASRSPSRPRWARSDR